MAKPVYIIVSQSGAEDKQTGAVSYFNIVEKMQIAPLPKNVTGPIQVQVIEVRVDAVWERENSDSEEMQFEHILRVISPNQKTIAETTNIFSFEKPRHRFTVNIRGNPPIEEPFSEDDRMIFRSRIRPKGGSDGDWLTQEYSVLLERIEKIEDGQAE
jgi:hypothetical protein